MSKVQSIDPVTGWRLYFPNIPTTLYYVVFHVGDTNYYKIGITTKSIKERFAKDKVPYDILWERTYMSGRTAYIREQKILKKYSRYRCKDVCILHSGNTELFSKNIMKDIHG